MHQETIGQFSFLQLLTLSSLCRAYKCSDIEKQFSFSANQPWTFEIEGLTDLEVIMTTIMEAKIPEKILAVDHPIAKHV